MAKRIPKSLESVTDELLRDTDDGQSAEAVTAPPAVAPVKAVDPVSLQTVHVKATLAPLRENVHMPTAVEVRLDPSQSKALRRLFDGLETYGARLANGKSVKTPADSIRYLLDQFA